MNTIIYLDFFKFKKPPFQIIPDDDFLYLSQQHSKAMAYMDYAVSQPGGFVVITGEVGAGKTILLKRLIKRFDKKVACISLPFTNLKGKELFQYIAEEAGTVANKESKVSLVFSLKKHFHTELDRGRPSVLIIDEAQNLTVENLEDIRMLAGLEVNNKPLLRVIMLGQPEFMLSVNDSEQLKQRVKLHYHLKGLSEEDVSKYIEYRLKIAGNNTDNIFTKNVINEIFKYSNGIPRLINKICDALLLCAFIEDRKYALKNDVVEVASDLMINIPKVLGMGNAITSNVAVKKISELAEDSNSFERMIYALEGINMSLEVLANNMNTKDEVE